jgi:hypothetical protein
MSVYIRYKRDVILYAAVRDDLWLPKKRDKTQLKNPNLSVIQMRDWDFFQTSKTAAIFN